jgi:transposase
VRPEFPEVELICAHDGTHLVEIGAEIREQLDIVPQQVRVIQHHSIKYACLAAMKAFRSRRHRRG